MSEMEANKTTEQLEHVSWEIVQDAENGNFRAAAERLTKMDRKPNEAAWLSAFVMSKIAGGEQVALVDAIAEEVEAEAARSTIVYGEEDPNPQMPVDDDTQAGAA